MRQGDAVVFDVKGKKYLGHVQRFITPGIFQLIEKNLFSIRVNEALEFYELNLEDSSEQHLSYASNSYMIVESESGQIDWQTKVPRLQVIKEN